MNHSVDLPRISNIYLHCNFHYYFKLSFHCSEYFFIVIYSMKSCSLSVGIYRVIVITELYL
jgi:hypothetical protein